MWVLKTLAPYAPGEYPDEQMTDLNFQYRNLLIVRNFWYITHMQRELSLVFDYIYVDVVIS